MFGDIMRETVRDTEGNRYGDIDMGGWTITAQRFSAPIREGFHYFGEWDGVMYVGPCNTADDVWQEILDIRAEIRTDMVQSGDFNPAQHNEIERASIIALARRLDASTLDAEASAAGPGRYEGADDLALVVSLDILSMNGCADDIAGSTEYGLHLARFGRHVLVSDSQGFVYVYTYACETDELAQAELDAEDRAQNPEEYDTED